MKLNLERFILAHLLILSIFILIELLVPSDMGYETILIMGYILIASVFSYDVINLKK